MKSSRRGKSSKKKTKPGKAYPQRKRDFAIVVAEELEAAAVACRLEVERISRLCRAGNQKFRDSDFDLEKDKQTCLYGIYSDYDEIYQPSDVQRITEIFENPEFFIDGASSNDIVQGAIGDCWFLSALAMLSSTQGLLEQCCVAQDEKVGVYGFVFFRNKAWVSVIVDDYLYTTVPKFEELIESEKALYHNDKAFYNSSARMRGKGLYFARSATEGETWVPLIEKAYAKAHGCYYALSGGYAGEGVEDMTGGVSTAIFTKDIFDRDRFWREELLKANVDRVFGCSFMSLSNHRNHSHDIRVQGLLGGHAYSILRAMEHKGKRFVVLRNPWGESEWTGPWSDGSHNWTQEWLEALPVIGHIFGDDGQFIMEYKDFLECWQMIERTMIFDSSWIMSCQWLHARIKKPFRPGSRFCAHVNEVTFSLPEKTPTIIVLSQSDERYYQPISGRCAWKFEFVLFKEGEKNLIDKSSYFPWESRSVNLEVVLEAGDYVIHVRLDRREYREEGYMKHIKEDNPTRALIRAISDRADARSLAANFNATDEMKLLPIALSDIAGRSLADGYVDEKQANRAEKDEETSSDEESEVEDEGPIVSDMLSVFLGLRVYTHEDAPASVSGQLPSRHN
ncbi:hypothetical protein VNI00_004176 [Paramarasmius palmivorus]|uniref:Calpain catalytic domain-containing protein n=1 Tax=Paramarasmius palmivorus TaxID=297713 RepID=A0AAW0DR81_9AGAR